ncbi:MAG: helix-turn-helix domain-containing protein, partial [Clostridia bacterium]|nr:helix-turn-helix domain-containing protein [Clostridia bacterium]
GYYTVEGHDYPLTPGCILVMRDGETHKLHISPDRPYERIALHFAPHLVDTDRREDLLAPFRARPLGQRNMLPPSVELTRVRDMLLRISDGTLSPEEYRDRILAYLPAILHELSRAARVEGQSSRETDAKSLVGEIIDYINQDPSAVEGMEALEQRFGFSRSYLNRTFRQSTGVSIWDYVILKRLTGARKAIRRGIPAATAAQSAGYTDYSSFYRQYKKRFGITPEEEKRLVLKIKNK